MSFWTLYWLSRLDGLKYFFLVGGWIAVAMLGFGIIVLCATSDPYFEGEKIARKLVKKSFKSVLLVSIVGIFIGTMVPTFKEAIVFMGIDYVTHNERVLENTDKAIDVFESYIDQKLNQLQGGTDEGKGK